MSYYQEIGKDDLDYFNDDLVDELDDGACDIMEVYRGGYSFLEIDNDDPAPDWCREIGWHRPTAEERRVLEEELEKQRLQQIEEMRQQADDRKKGCISIITQCFYGNRTGTEIRRNDVKAFIRGSLSPMPGEDFSDVVLKTIPVPGNENIVIVYDQTDEDKYIHVKYPKYAEEYRQKYGEELHYATCIIPELGIELHTRCFACRIDENGVLQSLEDGDKDKFIDFFPQK